MPRNKGWFRLYNRMIDSPQILELTDREFRGIISIWCLVSESEKDGRLEYSVNALKRRIWPDESLQEVQEIIDKYKSLDLLQGEDGCYEVPRWELHQYEYGSRIPKNRSDINRKDNGKDAENNRKDNGKLDPDSDLDPDKDNNPPISPLKTFYAEFVSLTNDEYTSLVAKLGSEEKVRACIDILDNYKGANGKRYKSDYRAILNWVVDKLTERELGRKTDKPLPPAGDEEKRRKKEMVASLYEN